MCSSDLEKHFHLLFGGVLGFVQDDEGVIERAPPHESQGRNLELATLEGFVDAIKPHEVIECVVQRTQIRVDLLRQVPRQEAQALASFHRRPGEHDALGPLALKGVKYRAIGAAALLRRNLLVYGLGGVIVPFIGIKAIDLILVALGLA